MLESRSPDVDEGWRLKARLLANSRTSKLRLGQTRQLLRLIGEATEFPENDPARARHLVAGVLRILRAAVGTCVTDCEPSGPGVYVSAVRAGWDDSTLPALHRLESEGSDGHPCCRELTRMCPMTAAATVTARRGDIVAAKAWYTSSYVQNVLLPVHLDHPLFSRRRLRPLTTIQGIGFYRDKNDRPFDEEDRNLLHLFHVECGSMLEPAACALGYDRRAGLAPRQRETLDLLLAGLGDKEIADRLGISPHTVNHYTKTIYRHFGVGSRATLIARHLSGRKS
jgi:DNA-binding CsgD family transcriptional regulator